MRFKITKKSKKNPKQNTIKIMNVKIKIKNKSKATINFKFES
jgi:hypothetical protein